MARQPDPLFEQLLPHVMKFVGSSGGGQWRFQLQCSVPRCRRMDTVSASRHTIRRQRDRANACEKFIRAGWRFKDGPCCPDCSRSPET